MATPAITVQGLGKQYRIGRRADYNDRLTESLSAAFRAPLRRLRGSRKAGDSTIWAIRDVSFDVARGDVVGVIGRNGSGKTTLLKVLSRITEPTEGRARVEGRLGSLLEVGTGFHPELTGRENVYMSGAVLGMHRREINAKFDEIVEFAGVGPFLDTPVKRYSSGMQVRLGFAVAAYLEPEILLVDEVLAVGDAEFQKRCLGKMSELGEGGRTILFVSHSMQAVLRLCRSAILLDHGGVRAFGPTPGVITSYLESETGSASHRQWPIDAAPGDSAARLLGVRVLPGPSGQGDEVDITEPIHLEFEYWTAGLGDRRPKVDFHAFNADGICLFAVDASADPDFASLPVREGRVRAVCTIPGNFLAEGRVTLNVALTTYGPGNGHALEQDAISFHVVDRTEGEGVRGGHPGDWPGVVRPMLDWEFLSVPNGS